METTAIDHLLSQTAFLFIIIIHFVPEKYSYKKIASIVQNFFWFSINYTELSDIYSIIDREREL